MAKFFSTIEFFLALLAPALVSAQGYGVIDTTVDNVGGPLPFLACGSGGCEVVTLALAIVTSFRPLLTIAGTLVLGILGIRMVVSQEEDRFEKTRQAMTGLVSGLILVYLLEPFVQAFYGTSGERFRGDMGTTALIVNQEVAGLIRWGLVLIASIAVLMIILSSLKAIVKGGEEGIAGIRKTIISVLAGLALLALHQTIASSFIENPTSPVPLLGVVVTLISYLMGFLALAATAVIIYMGIMLLLSFGNEERWQKAKSYFGRAALGFVVILVSLSIVNFIIGPALGA